MYPKSNKVRKILIVLKIDCLEIYLSETACCISFDNGAAPHQTSTKEDKSYLSTSGCLARKTARGGTIVVILI